MPHSYGVRARTRHMFAKKHRQHGPIHLSQYLMNVKLGDYVDIFANPSIHKGMPHKAYHGRTGIFEIWNLDETDYEVILADADEESIREHLRRKQHRFILEDGSQKISDGITSVEEVRALGLDLPWTNR